jgi:hypothetical protein
MLQASRLFAAVGLAPWLKTYPIGPPLRVAAHLRLIGRFEERLPRTAQCRREVPIAVGERRAIDLVLSGLPLRTGVEAETVFADEQALERSLNRKRQDACCCSIRSGTDAPWRWPKDCAARFPSGPGRSCPRSAPGAIPEPTESCSYSGCLGDDDPSQGSTRR